MTFLLDIINGVHKFLGYLDISPKYLNRGYTILSVIPTLYILRILYGLWLNENYFQFFLYGVGFLALLYFIILNVFYYFFDKNSKADVTQVFVKYLPDEAFNIQAEENSKKNHRQLKEAQKVQIDFFEDYQLKLAENMAQLVANGEVPINDLSNQDGFLIEANTLYPYYYVKKQTELQYVLKIGKNYGNLEEIGLIQLTPEQLPFEPVGLFIIGGDLVKDGIRYHEPYRLELVAKEVDSPNVAEPTVSSRMQRRRHSRS
ncbi:MAG: DUF6681 family protein [Enterococcus sp.]